MLIVIGGPAGAASQPFAGGTGAGIVIVPFTVRVR